MKKFLSLLFFCLMTCVASAQYVDLGLPSGTLWKCQNEDGFYLALRAQNLFAGQLPSIEQVRELKNNCIWYWKDNGVLIEGPNGNTMFLPANGYRDCNGKMGSVGTYGYYWLNHFGDSSSSMFNISSSGYDYFVGFSNCHSLNVRLVKKK